MSKNSNFNELEEKGESKIKKVKKILPAVVLASSYYYSIWLTIGLVIGYFGCKTFYKLFVENGKVDLIYLDFGKWQMHVHHWIMGVIVLAVVWVVDYFYLPTFFVGVVCGIIAHDIYDFNDWHKIIVKK
jgi:hypothetical protein